MKAILLVDDADVTRDAYAVFLDWAGYRTLVAGNGREAYEIARSEHPDLIVMDLNMPEVDGWDAARMLKSDPETEAIPLIAVSARLMSADGAERIRECGFSKLCTKPVPPTALLEEIRAQLDPEAQAA